MFLSTPSKMIPSLPSRLHSTTSSPKMAFHINRNPLYFSPNPMKQMKNFPINDDREIQHTKTISLLKQQIETLLLENKRLNEVVRGFQRSGEKLHYQTNELEDQINFLIQENEKLRNSNQNSRFYQELEAFQEEKTLCQEKIEDLHQKLTLIFEDNDKLASLLKERDEDFEKMRVICERETSLRVEIQNQYENLIQETKGFKGVPQEKSERNNTFLENQKKFENKIENLIMENEKLNAILTDKSKQILDLNEIIQQKNNILYDFEGKIEILLSENGKLHMIIEEKLKEFEENSSILQGKLAVAIDEKSKLQLMLEDKNEAELYWKKKFEEIECKVRYLFFNTQEFNKQ